MKNKPIIIEQTVNATPSKVWKAITDKDEMKIWYFDIADFKPQIGFEFQFYGGSEEKRYLHLCKITKVITDKKLAYSWKFDGYKGNTEVIFELFEEGNNTKLKLTHTGVETFPEDPDFSRESFFAGWTEIIGASLKNYLKK